MATLPSSRQTPNLDVAKQRANETLMEAQQHIERVRKLRSVPGLLGLPTAILEATQAFERLTMALGALMLGDDNDVYRTYLEDRLANQIRGNGD